MDDTKALLILKLFYKGCDNMIELARKAKVTRDEARGILKGARECGLLSYSTKDYNETFYDTRKTKLEKYLRTKGAIK